MPIFSLPSKYGIGTLGKAAYDFVDFLNNSGQSIWQILPYARQAMETRRTSPFHRLQAIRTLLILTCFKGTGC